jgi:pimeloyl-ACP methyl ester carboxylesterase
MTLGPLPVLAAGEGEPLLYLGGLLPVAGVDPPLARRTAEFSVRPFAETRRVFYVNRRQGLAPGMTIAAFATEHAEAIAALNCGPVDVLGVSTGGSIAQQLTADHPEAVRRLVLVGTGCRLSTKTRRMQSRVAEHVRAGRRQRAVASLAVGIIFPDSEPLARLLAPLILPLAGRVGDLSDLAATIEAEDRFDLARCESTIRALTDCGRRPRPFLSAAAPRRDPATDPRKHPASDSSSRPPDPHDRLPACPDHPRAPTAVSLLAFASSRYWRAPRSCPAARPLQSEASLRSRDPLSFQRGGQQASIRISGMRGLRTGCCERVHSWTLSTSTQPVKRVACRV